MDGIKADDFDEQTKDRGAGRRTFKKDRTETAFRKAADQRRIGIFKEQESVSVSAGS